MAVYIASGTTASNGADFTLASGTTSTVNLFAAGEGIPNGASAPIQIKASNGSYYTLGVLDQNNIAQQVFGPGIFRVVRNANAVAFGVDKD